VVCVFGALKKVDVFLQTSNLGIFRIFQLFGFPGCLILVFHLNLGRSSHNFGSEKQLGGVLPDTGLQGKGRTCRGFSTNLTEGAPGTSFHYTIP